jgi:hypothetical protein
MDWIDLAQDRGRWRALVNGVMNLRVLKNAGKFLTSWGPVSFSGRTLLLGVSFVLNIRYFLGRINVLGLNPHTTNNTIHTIDTDPITKSEVTFLLPDTHITIFGRAEYLIHANSLTVVFPCCYRGLKENTHTHITKFTSRSCHM